MALIMGAMRGPTEMPGPSAARTTRRPLRHAAALLGLAVALAGCGNSAPDDEIPEPPVATSRNGVLELTLTQAPARVTVAGQTFTSNVFNGQYIPPVLKLGRGDRLDLRFVNRIAADDASISGPQVSNMHYHGMTVPPGAPGDDVFLQIAAGAEYHYRWQVPLDHSQGAHWYHPHAHGFVEGQILSGMSGLLMIDGLVTRHYPAFAGLRERHLLLKDIVLPGAADRAPYTKTINGVLGGKLLMRPGELQVWHLGNVGADAYFDIAVDGIELWEISRDGNLLTRPRRITSAYLPPGSRCTVVAVAPPKPGTFDLQSQAVDTGPQGDPNPRVVLASVVVSGDAWDDSAALQTRLRHPPDGLDAAGVTVAQVAALPITRQRTVIFSETADGNTFFINGREYDEARDDVVVNLGDVEEWTIRNVSGERHVFHIHQLDFLVKAVNGVAVNDTSLREVVDLPYQSNGTLGEVKVIIPFTNPRMVGRFVFHCHIVGHEDAGMMANLVVLPAGQGVAMAPGRMRTLAPMPRAGWRDWVARWTGGPTVPDISQLDDALCRSADAAFPRRSGRRTALAADAVSGFR